MEAFLDFLRFERRYSPHTLVSYQTDLGQFAAYLKSAYELTDPAQATHPLIRGWVVELMQENLDPRTVNRKVACLRSYYKFLLRTGAIDGQPHAAHQGPENGQEAARVCARRGAERLAEFV